MVAVIFLAPSSGLITLTVPDEPDGNISVIPDITHTIKRTSDDSSLIGLDILATTYVLHHTFFSIGIALPTSAPEPYMDPSIPDNIRAPPIVTHL
jgi:hypothetical protein